MISLFLIVISLFVLINSQCAIDSECAEPGGCVISKCIEPDCILELDGESECSPWHECETGFKCNTYDCKCYKVTPQHCTDFMNDYLSVNNNFVDRDLSFKMEIFVLLREYELECKNSEGEFMSVNEFMFLPTRLSGNIENE